jgi:alpha-beta hydrolase superfamily lysophospholipase
MPWTMLLVALLLLAGCAVKPSAVASSRLGEPRAPTAISEIGKPNVLLPQVDQPLYFDRGGWRLYGTLTLPERRSGERVPGVVIVHGSGPLSRDGVMRGQLGLGFGFELPVYRRLAEALAEHGYAVYRYDKRTCGESNDCAKNRYPAVPYELLEVEFNTTEYLRDAEAAVDAMAAHPAIDGRRVFIIGHSQGGSLVPALLTSRRDLPAGVMLAPPFHALSVLIEQQSERVAWAFSAAGQSDRADRDRALLTDAARALQHLESGTHLGEPILGQPPGVWASWVRLAREAPGLAARLKRPLLVLGGSYDYNVSAIEIEAWRAFLRRSTHVPHRVRVLPCVTHALNCITQPDPTRIEPSDIGHEVAGEVVREVVGFLNVLGERNSSGHRATADRPAACGSHSG